MEVTCIRAFGNFRPAHADDEGSPVPADVVEVPDGAAVDPYYFQAPVSAPPPAAAEAPPVTTEPPPVVTEPPPVVTEPPPVVTHPVGMHAAGGMHPHFPPAGAVTPAKEG